MFIEFFENLGAVESLDTSRSANRVKIPLDAILLSFLVESPLYLVEFFVAFEITVTLAQVMDHRVEIQRVSFEHVLLFDLHFRRTGIIR
jgi:hypothetical protein